MIRTISLKSFAQFLTQAVLRYTFPSTISILASHFSPRCSCVLSFVDIKGHKLVPPYVCSSTRLFQVQNPFALRRTFDAAYQRKSPQ